MTDKLNEQTNLKGLHTVLPCSNVADPATFLASNSVSKTLFSSENSHGEDTYF